MSSHLDLAFHPKSLFSSLEQNLPIRFFGMENAFLYAHLPANHIRLLQGSQVTADNLVCERKTLLLDTTPDFYALSYTWGIAAATERFV